MAATVAIVDLHGGIAALLSYPSHTDLVDGATGKLLIFAVKRWRGLGVVCPLGGFLFGAGHRKAGPMEGQCVHTEATMVVESSDVGDATLVAVEDSSPACPWVCICLFVDVNSK
jgi:hypothetical protein